MNKYSNLLVNIGLFALNTVATKLVSFFLVPLYTYYMNAEEYGLTDMALTVIFLALPLATFSISDAAVRFLISDKSKSSEYIAISFALTGVSVIIVIALTPLLDFAIFGGLGAYKGWFILAYATTALFQLCGQIARGIGSIRLIPICAAISSLTTFALAILLIGTLDMSIIGFFLSNAIGPLLAALIYLFAGQAKMAATGFLSILRHGNRKKTVAELCKPMLQYSFPLMPNSLFWWIGTSINRFFITGMLGIAASGMFAAASKIPNLLNIVYSIFQQAWQISAFEESDQQSREHFFSTVFCVLQAAMCIVCGGLSFFSPWIASLLLQGEFYDAWTMIPTLLLSNLFNSFSAYYGTVYTSTMHTGYIMRSTAAGAICCIVLTPVLILLLGVYGACLASAASQILVFLMRAIDSRKYIAFKVGWGQLTLCFFFLTVQAVVPLLYPEGWQLISILCVFAVILVQLTRIILLIKSLPKPLLKKKQR